MPTYEYQCVNCGNRFELFQSITAAAPGHCSLCGGPLRRRISGGAGVIIRPGGSSAAAGNQSFRSRQGLCSLERKGRTCCGRAERCDDSPCQR
jgi:putative FmdB family regulatory protein